jgi:Lrp/AsnC family leucine-responsive transcriptional regulator
MDEFDVAILNRVQQNCRLTAEQLSKEVGLSPSACQRRLTKLRETGIIEREISVIAPETVGRRLTMVVEVTLEREHPNIMDEFKKSMRETPEVMQCYYVTGEVDFILILTARDMAHYEHSAD